MTDDLHHLAAAYALDALDPAEREAFEVHYPTCGLCLSEVIELQETAALLAGASAVAPPPELRSAVLAGIARTRQVPPAVSGQYTVTGQTRSRNGARSRLASRFPTRLLAMAAAIAIVAGVAGGIWATVATDGGRGVTPADVAAAGDAITTDLLGVGQTDLRVIWSPGLQQAVVVGSGLATAGSNQTYALWAAEGEQVVPAGLFDPDAGGEVEQVLDLTEIDDVEPEGWGVTIEPDGGSPQPTSDILFFGTI